MNPGGPPGGFPPGGYPGGQPQAPQGYGPQGQQPQQQQQQPGGYGAPPPYGQPAQGGYQQQQPPMGQPGMPQGGMPGMPQGGMPGMPQGGMPGMPGGMSGMPGMPGAAANRFGQAQSSLKGASSMLKMMQYGFAALGALLLVIGVIMLVAVDFMTGISMIISGVIVAGVAWFTLPKFMGMVGGATAMVDQLHAKEQVAMSGTPATARVLSMQQTGAMINMNPQVQAVLEVQGPQGPYQVQTMAVVPQMNIPQFQPGATIHVRINPANPHDVAVVF